MLTRRQLIQTAAATAGGVAATHILNSPALALAAPMPRRAVSGRLGKLQILQVGVGGSIAPADRDQLSRHGDVVFTGLCDVDANALAEVSKQHPEAFTCLDFREAFDKHGDRFDAVVVCTPDHNHAVIDLWAMRANKHVYGQKPLVQQLSEVSAIEAAVAARPKLVTQTGNQRMGPEPRQHAVDILRRGLLGKAIEAHVWIAGPGAGTGGYFWYGGLQDPIQPPENIDWPLWLGAAQDAPCRPGLIGLQWRSSWDYGTGQLGDWCTHLLDILYFAYDLPSPRSVLANTLDPSDFYHARGVRSTLTYDISSQPNRGLFADDRFVVHYADQAQAPSRAALGLPEGKFGNIGTLVVCEGGVICCGAEGPVEVWIDGKAVDSKSLDGLGKITSRNHWHAWVDAIVGGANRKTDGFVQSPFAYSAKMAEAGLLCSKAARFPQQELMWDKASLSFTNSKDATETIVRREYRKGFELPAVS
ncbi:MAG: Inositol 2-dehydrogenase [Planctomycetota bacterium]|jgi:predicted dehydrogenase